MSAYRNDKKPGTMMPATPLMKESNQFFDNTPLDPGMTGGMGAVPGFIGTATSEIVDGAAVASTAMGTSGGMAQGQTKPTNMG